ncbi:MAG: hypothetical protein P4L35_02620 [Ignavibacteriaceae bacterium]|nr:hypothetical protein [Ignavibacteriaceae bacterium]
MKLLSVIIISLLALFQTAVAQQGSVYTRYGLGDVQSTYSARRLGMGELGTSVADEDFIGTLNPAGWNMLKMTRIEFGVAYNGLFVNDNIQKKYYASTQVTGFTMAFPVSSTYGIGVALGIIPVTDVNYQVTTHNTDPNPIVGDYDLSYIGSGGLSKVFIGSSYRLPFDLSIGAEFDYYFGNINYSSSAVFTGSNNITSGFNKKYRPKAIGITLGLISPDLLKASSSFFSDLHIGVSANLIFNSTIDSLLTSSSSVRVDTINYYSYGMKIPNRINAGASVILNKRFLVSLDYSYQPWSEFTINNMKPGFMRNLSMMSAGFEYRPVKELGGSFFDFVIFRGGLSYEQTQYFINNTGINQYSAYGGCSFPISLQNTIDVGVQYYIRGQVTNDLIKENGIKVAFGISFGDIWFLRDTR